MQVKTLWFASFCLMSGVLAMPKPAVHSTRAIEAVGLNKEQWKRVEESTDGTQIGEGWKRDEDVEDGTQIGEGWKRDENVEDGTQIGEGWKRDENVEDGTQIGEGW